MTVAVHAAAMGLFGVNTWAIRAFDIAWTAAAALLVAAIAFELWKRKDAALAAGLAYPFLYYQIDYWTTAQTDAWMTLPCTLAVWGQRFAAGDTSGPTHAARCFGGSPPAQQPALPCSSNTRPG